MDSKRTEERILRAACELVAEGGYEALTTRSVAERAGVSPGSVHHHYINKEGLVDACIDVLYDQYSDMASRFHEALAESGSLRAFIDRAIREIFRAARSQQPIARLLLAASVQRGQLDPARMDLTQKPFLASATPVLAAATGLSQTNVRVRLQAMAFTLARFAVSSDEELRLILGTAEPEALEDQLVQVAQALFPSR